ncbi:hypothetical protein QE152_g25398 [Popillia japonica]|uniref:Uncharacterized protein n=1 Tax=Popillia japonica TaxID=7064 RepID=A0AAW1K274_POPJA
MNRFLSSYVTARVEEPEGLSDAPGPLTSDEVVAGTMNTLASHSTKASTNIVTPEAVRPHVKVQARNGIRKGKKKTKSTVLTDTPNKEEIELAHEQKMQKIRLR